MNINIIAVGKIKEKFLKDASFEYEKRISRYAELTIIEIDEEMIKNENDNNVLMALEKEAERIKKKISNIKTEKTYIIALDIEGKELSTIDLFKKVRDLTTYSTSDIIFIIGGSYGLDKSIKNMADFRLSFSKLTFPHQLFRIILLEQLYRIFKIEKNEPYHK